MIIGGGSEFLLRKLIIYFFINLSQRLALNQKRQHQKLLKYLYVIFEAETYFHNSRNCVFAAGKLPNVKVTGSATVICLF